MQPTLSKTSTHARAVSGAARGRTGGAAEPGASMAPGPLPPAGPAPVPSVLDSSRRDRRWCLTSRHRPGERRARTRSCRYRAIKTASATAALNDGWLSRSETPSAGWKPSPGPRRSRRSVCARFDRRRSFARRFSLRASSTRALSAATESARTDACATNRLLQPSKSMGTPTARPVLRTEPAVSARTVARREPELANGTTSGADTPYARGQGRHRPAGLRVSLRDGSRRGQTRYTAEHLASFAADCLEIWSPRGSKLQTEA
jgi:hypothetical protein